MNRLLPIDIGLVLKIAAEGAAHGLGDKARNGKGEEQHHETGARRQINGAPSGSIAPHHPCRKTRARPKHKEQPGGIARKFFGNVVQHIMPAFVAEDEQNLVIRHLIRRRIPHHVPLRRSNPGHKRIDPRRFLAGLDQVHAAGRNIDAGARHHLSLIHI